MPADPPTKRAGKGAAQQHLKLKRPQRFLQTQGGFVGVPGALKELAAQYTEHMPHSTIEQKLAIVNAVIRDKEWLVSIDRDIYEFEVGSGCGSQSMQFRAAGHMTREFDNETRSPEEDMIQVEGMLLLTHTACRVQP